MRYKESSEKYFEVVYVFPLSCLIVDWIDVPSCQGKLVRRRQMKYC